MSRVGGAWAWQEMTLMDWGTSILPPSSAPAAGECHIWPVPIADNWAATGLLDASEQRQASRCVAHHARRAFITSRVAQCLIGGHYLDQAAQAVAVERRCHSCARDHGRPRWVGRGDLDYSVSHAGDWLLVAVVGTGRVGADIERPSEDLRAVETHARKVFTPDELAHWMTLTPNDRLEWFYRTWCRKEATVKLTCHGLRIRPSLVNVSESAATLLHESPLWPKETIWLRQLPAPTPYLASLATTVSCHTIQVCGRLK